MKSLTTEFQLINEDINSGLSLLPDKSVSMTILDPPYYRKVDQDWDKQWFTFDQYLEWCEVWIKEVSRVSMDSGTAWLFGYPYELSKLLPLFEKYGFKLKQQIVIDKGLKSIAGRSSDQLKQFPTATEYLYFFYKDSREMIRQLLQSERKRLDLTGNQVNQHLGKAVTGGGTFSTIASLKKPLEYIVYPTEKDWIKLQEIFDLPEYDTVVFRFNSSFGITDVWNDIDFYINKKDKIHPTQKPVDLINRIIDTGVPNKHILDCFMGSGTTAICSNGKSDRFTGIEIDQDMFDQAFDRIHLHIPHLRS